MDDLSHGDPLTKILTRIISGNQNHTSSALSDLRLDGDDIDSSADLNGDGRVNICITRKHSKLQKALLNRFHSPDSTKADTQFQPNQVILPSFFAGESDATQPPPLNVVIQIVGSRGDVQPFIAIGKILKEKYGHRVRLATHATFKSFVEENGLEFFNIGGDPNGLMAYMVKNPGLLPSRDSLKHGDVAARRKDIEHILSGCWRSCIEAGDGTESKPTFHEINDTGPRPFIADAIIANPPGFAHVHCAEKLGIPFHIMFTMPWTPTQAFPHPLANITSTDGDQHLANFLSYLLVAILTWQGLGSVINKFRVDTLHLEAASVMWTPILTSAAKAPFTYCFSPALIPKPKDWGDNVRVVGFYFLDLASNYTPDPDLVKFLEAGTPPVYIGFGSIVVDDPNKMTMMIFDAVQKAGIRALVSKGWGGLGADDLEVPENIRLLGNVPHDWLFKHVSAVVHHGGAGTTATGIAAGKPTLVVPFFGDQPFWGAMVARAGAGPDPIPHKKLNSDNLSTAIQFCLRPETQEAAKVMASRIAQEKGPDLGAQSFHDFLPQDRMRCALVPERSAAWRIKGTKTRLSSFAVAALCKEGLMHLTDFKINRVREYDLSDQPWDPVSGGASALLGTMANLMVGTANLPSEIATSIRARAAANKDAKVRDALANEATSHSKTAKPNSSDNISLSSKTPTSLTTTTSNSDARSLHLADLVVKSTPGRNCYGLPESDKLDQEGSHHAARAVARDMSHLIAFPREFVLALARGFHNAPKLYHDRTVRQPDKVTDLRTGLKGAGKEFGLEMYDAVSGLVTQPYKGAKESGAAGFAKGIGKGVGGLLLKPEAAVLGALGYTMQGVYRQLHKHSTTIEHQIAAARIAEGLEAWEMSSVEQRQEIIIAWHMYQEAKARSRTEQVERRGSWRKSMSRAVDEVGRRSSSIGRKREEKKGRDVDSIILEEGETGSSRGSSMKSVFGSRRSASVASERRDSSESIRETPVRLFPEGDAHLIEMVKGFETEKDIMGMEVPVGKTSEEKSAVVSSVVPIEGDVDRL